MVTFTEDELINKIYGDIHLIPLIPPPVDYFLDRVILAPQNINVQETNEKFLKKMQGDEIIYHSTDSIENEGDGVPDDVSADFLRSVDNPSLPQSELKMKIGCPLMLLQNLDPGKGLCNGTRMILLHAHSHILEVMVISGNHCGEKAFLPRITLTPSTRQHSFSLR